MSKRSQTSKLERLINEQDLGLRMAQFAGDPMVERYFAQGEEHFTGIMLDLKTTDDERRAAAVSIKALRDLKNLMLRAVDRGQRAERDFHEQSKTAEVMS